MRWGWAKSCRWTSNSCAKTRGSGRGGACPGPFRRSAGAGRDKPGPYAVLLGIAQSLANPPARRLLQHGVAERDVGEAEPAVPEEDGLVLARPALLLAADDL